MNEYTATARRAEADCQVGQVLQFWSFELPENSISNGGEILRWEFNGYRWSHFFENNGTQTAVTKIICRGSDSRDPDEYMASRWGTPCFSPVKAGGAIGDGIEFPCHSAHSPEQADKRAALKKRVLEELADIGVPESTYDLLYDSFGFLNQEIAYALEDDDGLAYLLPEGNRGALIEWLRSY